MSRGEGWPRVPGRLILGSIMARLRISRVGIIGLVSGVLLAVSLVLAAGFQHRGAYRYLNVFQEVWSLTVANYVEPVDKPKLLDGAYRGMLASLDSASGYLSPEDRKLLSRPLGPARSGMQVLQSGGIPVVVRVDPGSPADGAGLERGDQVWKIDDRPTRTLPWSLLIRLLSGEPGKKVSLEVLKGRNFKIENLDLTLESWSSPGVTVEVLEGPVIHLRVFDLDRVDPVKARAALVEARSDQPSAPLLVDFRGVVGVDPAVIERFSGWLLPPGASLQLVSRSGPAQRVESAGAGDPDLPSRRYVLEDSSTAGAAEALVALLEEQGGALSCGRKTYGLGGVPEVIDLGSRAALLLTTREMRTPSGVSWSGQGLTPRKVLPLKARSSEEQPKGEDPMLDQALSWIRAGAPLESRAKQPAVAG